MQLDSHLQYAYSHRNSWASQPQELSKVTAFIQWFVLVGSRTNVYKLTMNIFRLEVRRQLQTIRAMKFWNTPTKCGGIIFFFFFLMEVGKSMNLLLPEIAGDRTLWSRKSLLFLCSFYFHFHFHFGITGQYDPVFLPNRYIIAADFNQLNYSFRKCLWLTFLYIPSFLN